MRRKMEIENVKLIKLWIERFVIGLRLCPFAHFSFFNNTIYYDVSTAAKISVCEDDLMDMVSKMNTAKQCDLSNAFLIFDQPLTFDFMLSLKKRFDANLKKIELDTFFQSVVFHPEFQFGDEHFYAAGNFTNRSPLPMVHILRVEEVAKAIEATEKVEDIPFRNKKVLESIDIKNISEVFEDCFMEKIKSYI